MNMSRFFLFFSDTHLVFFGKYSRDMLEHHTRLNLDLLLLLLLLFLGFISFLVGIMELQESMP